jgi:hypothetical protein
MNHNDCLHSKDSKGRAACRKAGGPAAYEFNFRQALIAEAEAVCADCFSLARESASENLDLEYSDTQVLIQARDYMFDRSALSACSAHSHLC